MFTETGGWNAGGPPDPTRWVQACFPGAVTVTAMSLKVDQSPNGPTKHEVQVSADGRRWRTAWVLEGMRLLSL